MKILTALRKIRQDKKKRRLAYKIYSLLKIIFHTVLVLLDIISDFLYVSKVEFYNEGLKGACIFFILIIPVIIYSTTLIILLKQVKKERENNSNKSKYLYCLTFFWAIIGPTISILYPTLEKFDMLAPDKLKIVFQLATIEFLFESLPQLIIQGSNNSLTNNWTGLTKFSFVLSMISLIRGCYVLSTTFYRRQFEDYIKKFSDEKLSEIQETLKISIIQPQINTFTKNEITENPSTTEKYSQEDLSYFIKFKIEEKFLTGSIFKIPPDKPIFKNPQLSEELEKILKSYKKKYLKLHFKKSGYCERLTNPYEFFIILEFILMFIAWFCNFLYLVIARFENESLRFACLLFLGFGYIGSIAGKFDKVDGVNFKRLILFKLCLVSHFDYFMSSLFDKKVKTSFPVFKEFLVALFCWMPLIAIQGSNNKTVGKGSGIYLAVIVMNSYNLVIVCFRILDCLIRKFYCDSSVEPDIMSSGVDNKIKSNNTFNLENSLNSDKAEIR